jgi:hypothetical protein
MLTLERKRYQNSLVCIEKSQPHAMFPPLLLFFKVAAVTQYEAPITLCRHSTVVPTRVRCTKLASCQCPQRSIGAPHEPRTPPRE